MSISITDGTSTITLSPDLYWSDENDWHPVEQTVERSVTGQLIVQVNARIQGRPITLEPENEDSAWMTRAVVDSLRNWAAVPGKTMTLTIRGGSRLVMFRHHDGQAVEASPVIHYSDVLSGDFYRVTLRFMEVNP